MRKFGKANLPAEIGITTYCTRKGTLLEYASLVWGGLPKHLAEALQSIQNGCLHIIGIPRISLTMLEDRCNQTGELERILNDTNLPNQIFRTKPNTSHDYNFQLRSKPGSEAIPKSGTETY